MERCDTCQYVGGLFDGHWGRDCFRNLGSPKGGVMSITKVWQLMERCDGHEKDVKVLKEVWQLSGRVTSIREV